MLIYRGIPYLAFGNRSLFTGSKKDYYIKIERVYRPFMKYGWLFPIILKSLVPKNNSSKPFSIYNVEAIQQLFSLASSLKIFRFKHSLGHYTEMTIHDLKKALADPEYRMKKASRHSDLFSVKVGDVDIGNIDDAISLILHHKITHFENNGLGFSPETNTWYGWSHRAMRGFTIGSTVKFGDIAFVPSNDEEFIREQLEWHKPKSWSQNGRTITLVNDLGNEHIIEIPEVHKGYGEWTAYTLAAAKKMAEDFAEDVA